MREVHIRAFYSTGQRTAAGGKRSAHGARCSQCGACVLWFLLLEALFPFVFSSVMQLSSSSCHFRAMHPSEITRAILPKRSPTKYVGLLLQHHSYRSLSFLFRFRQ